MLHYKKLCKKEIFESTHIVYLLEKWLCSKGSTQWRTQPHWGEGALTHRSNTGAFRQNRLQKRKNWVLLEGTGWIRHCNLSVKGLSLYKWISFCVHSNLDNDNFLIFTVGKYKSNFSRHCVWIFLVSCFNSHLNILNQWQIQDFPLGAPASLGGANIRCRHFSTETCVKMKELGPRWGAVAPPWSANVNIDFQTFLSKQKVPVTLLA